MSWRRPRISPVDLVITEAVFASGVSGLDIVRACKAAAPVTRVLVVSGSGSLDDAVDALRAGAFDYLAKSGDVDALRATVDARAAVAAEQAGPAHRCRGNEDADDDRAVAEACCSCTSRCRRPRPDPRPS